MVLVTTLLYLLSTRTNGQRYLTDPSATVFLWLILHMFTGILIGLVVNLFTLVGRNLSGYVCVDCR